MRGGHVVLVLAACAAGLCIGVPATAAVSGWAIERTPSPTGATYSELEGVSCASAHACTAVGYYRNSAGKFGGLAERWNGKKWTIEPTPNPAGAVRSSLYGVSCTSARACTAVGYNENGALKIVTLTERWNGKRWRIEPTPNPARALESSLYGVSCTAAGACTTVGRYENGAGGFATLAEHWNGRTWTIDRTPNPAGAKASVLEGVSCTATGTCTTVGHYENAVGRYVTLAEHWNGRTWTIDRTPNPAGAKASVLEGVSCTATGTCTTVGYFRNGAGKQLTLAERWNDKDWTIDPTPNPAGAVWSSLYAVSCTVLGTCTAVGPYRNSAGKQLTLAEHWNGKEWTIQPTPNSAGATSSCLYGTSCTAAGACTAVGHYRNRAGRKLTLAQRHR